MVDGDLSVAQGTRQTENIEIGGAGARGWGRQARQHEKRKERERKRERREQERDRRI